MAESVGRIDRLRRSGSVTRHGLLITLGLSLVIALATGIQVHRVVEESQGKDHIFECEECHHQFGIPMDDYDCLHNDHGPYGVVKVCPRCGKRAGLCTITCPSCGKNVLRPADGICVHCKRNMLEVLSEKTAAAMKKKGITPRRTSSSRPADPRARPPLDAIAIQSTDLFAQCEQLLDPQDAGSDGDAQKLAWARSYVMLAYQIMFEVSGVPDYLTNVLEHTEQVQAMRSDRLGQEDQVRGRVMPAWVSSAYSEGKPYAWLVHAGMITHPMARCAAAIKRDPSLAHLVPRADRIIADVDQTVRAFEDDYRDGPGPDEGRYISPPLQADLPLNQQNAMGRTLVAMYLATGDDWYRQRAVRLAQYFRNRIRFDGGRATWSHSDDDPRGEDISHAAISVDFAFACYQADIVFDQRDIKRIAATFSSLVRPGGFADRMDATGDTKQYGPSAGAWGELAWVQPQIRRTLADYLGAHYSDNPALGMLSAAYLVATQLKFQKQTPYVPSAQPDVAAVDAASQAGSGEGPAIGEVKPAVGDVEPAATPPELTEEAATTTR